MARPSTFNDIEDEIVLRYSGHPAEIVNAALVKAGGTPRAPQQIAQRRYYLTTRKKASRQSGRHSRIGRIEAERQATISEIAQIEKRHRTLIEHLRELNAELSAEVSAINGGDPSAPRTSSGTT